VKKAILNKKKPTLNEGKTVLSKFLEMIAQKIEQKKAVFQWTAFSD
jgi:hypothetical protein